MFTVLITSHDENIHKLIKQEEPHIEEPNRTLGLRPLSWNYSRPMASLVLTDSSQLISGGFEKLPDQIMYPYAEPYDLQKHVFSSCHFLQSKFRQRVRTWVSGPVYNLAKYSKVVPYWINIPRPRTAQEFVGSRYSSRFRGSMGLELGRKNKQGHGTFGLAELRLNKPTEFLKKNTRIVAPRPVIEGPRCLKPALRPPLPPRLVPNKARDQEERKNFRAVNVARVVKAVPRQPRRKFVDTRRGDFHDLETSGLLPRYIYSKTLGRVPGYLLRRLSEQEEGQRGKEERKHQHQGPTPRYITESERRSLLEVSCMFVVVCVVLNCYTGSGDLWDNITGSEDQQANMTGSEDLWDNMTRVWRPVD
uniref:Uncharacterized protein n=1 Tax=Timema poppense TaxID=170557 RepID=A0A7R9DM70_TIMPO|nr:unnamed protein product [Timema poppensis]